MIPFICNVQEKKFSRKQASGHLGQGEKRGVTANGHRGSTWVTEIFKDWTVMMAAHTLVSVNSLNITEMYTISPHLMSSDKFCNNT